MGRVRLGQGVMAMGGQGDVSNQKEIVIDDALAQSVVTDDLPPVRRVANVGIEPEVVVVGHTCPWQIPSFPMGQARPRTLCV